MAKESATSSDPFSAWREWVEKSERQLNSFFNEMMGSDRYGRFLRQFSDLQIDTQKNMNDAMTRFFTSLNLPTRDDVLALNQRLGAIEERLRVIEAGIGATAPADAAPRTNSSGPRPPRTRRPPGPRGDAR
ncbi:MAG TPA: hypothetical protein VKS22_03820 [Candidatus Binataceae bacterium]|nr:hypothetical protein [Candidatus Binataceae bacterium]